MTFPGFLDDLADLTHPAHGAQENEVHRVILTAHEHLLDLDTKVWQALTAIFRGHEDEIRSRGVKDLGALVSERREWASVLSDLLTLPCHQTANDTDAPGGPAEAPETDEEREADIVAACRRIFSERGDPEMLTTRELLAALRSSSGGPFGKWHRHELTPRRLAMLLAPHGIRPRNLRLPDGSQHKGYRRTPFVTDHQQPHRTDRQADGMPGQRAA